MLRNKLKQPSYLKRQKQPIRKIESLKDSRGSYLKMFTLNNYKKINWSQTSG